MGVGVPFSTKKDIDKNPLLIGVGGRRGNWFKKFYISSGTNLG